MQIIQSRRQLLAGLTALRAASIVGLRAVLKAVDLCVSDPQVAAKRSADKGFASSYDYGLRTLSAARYDVWREFDPEDTLRFYALRMHELGMIESSPQEIIANGTDFRLLNELKRELKG
jgi:NitT/TauT family transport system substrate-binding protein